MGKLQFFVCVLGVVSAACSPLEENDFANICDFSAACADEKAGYTVQLKMSPEPIPLEEEIAVTLKMPDQYIFKTAYIEGVNMFMGRTPVVINNQTDGVLTGVTFLGSCSEPRMYWRLTAVFEYSKNGKRNEARHYFTFQTRQ